MATGLAKRKKVAFVGASVDTMTGAAKLFGNPEWEIWTVNAMYKTWPDLVSYITRWFYLHSRDMRGHSPGVDTSPEMWRWFSKQRNFMIYLRQTYDDIPMSVKYPRKEVREHIRELSLDPTFSFFRSTFSWMLALAMHEKFEEIDFYGIEMGDVTEYAYQQLSFVYLIGLARGRGVKVNILPESQLLKCVVEYGFDDEAVVNFAFKKRFQMLQGRLNQFSQDEQNARDQKNKMHGALSNMQYVNDCFLYGGEADEDRHRTED